MLQDETLQSLQDLCACEGLRPQGLLPICSILVDRPRWLNEIWFAQFLKTVAGGRLVSILKETNSIIFLEGYRNRVVWEAMAVCSSVFSLPPFPRRVYLKNLVSTDRQSAMRAIDKDTAIFLFESVRTPAVDSNVIRDYLDLFLGSCNLPLYSAFAELLKDGATRLCQA